MQIRVFTADENGFIKIRPEDFELLLNDVYSEGYSQKSLIIGFQEQKESPKDAVYPTWEEYFISKGILKPFWDERGTPPGQMYIYAKWALENRISADVAKKLGIEPQED